MSMADKTIFTVEWEGLDDFNHVLDKMYKEHESIIMEELTDFGQDVETGTKALVPIDESPLEDSINFGKARRFGSSFELTGGSNKVYALRRHEEPYRMGVHDKLPGDSYYVDGRGAGTRFKPTWRGIKPGRKYLENAIKALDSDYNKMNERVLDRIMRLSK